jgi:tetratricopeptide (TPR) repeat protein
MQIEGQSSSVYNSRGNVFAALQRYDEAAANYDKAIALQSDFAEAFCNRGLALQELNRFDEALASYVKAIALTPDYAEAFCSRGATLQALKRLDEALANYDRAIALNPHYADAYMNRALIRLLIGRYHEGWPDNEWRWKVKDCASNRPDIKTPTWRGENLSGRHILVFSEQGLGDVIQFVRFLPPLAERKCKVTLLAPAKLVSLLRLSSDQIEIISDGECRKH